MIVYITEAVGVVVSIQFTVAVVLQVLPAKSWKVKMKLPFPVKVCVVVFIQVSVSPYHVNVAMTFPLVAVSGL